MGLNIKVVLEDVENSEIESITSDIVGGLTPDKGELVDEYHDLAKELIYDAIEELDEDLTPEEEQDIMDDNLEEVKEELAQPLIQAVSVELETMQENIESALIEFNY